MINHEDLLARYINHISVEEGTVHLADQPPYFTDEEWAELNRLANQPEGPLRDPQPAVQQTGKVTIELDRSLAHSTLTTFQMDGKLQNEGSLYLRPQVAEALLSQLAGQNSVQRDNPEGLNDSPEQGLQTQRSQRPADYEDASQRYTHLDRAVQQATTIQAELAPLAAFDQANQALKELLNVQAEAVSAANELIAVYEALRKVWPTA